MRLTLHPSVRRVDLEWNVPAMWQATDKDQTQPTPARIETVIPWLLWRSLLKVHWRSLEGDEAWAIDACAHRQTFGDLCEGLCEWIEESRAAMRAASMLKRWITGGLIARVILD